MVVVVFTKQVDWLLFSFYRRLGATSFFHFPTN